MTTPSMISADAYDAEVLSNAKRYAASLFLGRGKYANAEADKLDGIKALAEKMSADHC